MKIYDVHAHLMADLGGEPWHYCKPHILRGEELYGISKFYISTIDGPAYYPDADVLTRCNDMTLDFMKERPDLVRGMVYLNPKNENTLDELQRRVDEGFVGVKLWVSQYCDDPSVYPLAERLIELDMPLLLHVFYKSIAQFPDETRANHVRNLADRYPELKIVMAHLGGDVYHAMRVIKDCPNVYVDNSGSRGGGPDMTHAYKMVGADRLLFGSDSPIDAAPALGQILDLDIPEEEMEKMLWKNAHKLFKEDLR
ncbi:MAG: amidohydrolase [Oscillospiraceae bacterium]|nr:amidohydrolase [Oscillospiraceae bacterium]